MAYVQLFSFQSHIFLSLCFRWSFQTLKIACTFVSCQVRHSSSITDRNTLHPIHWFRLRQRGLDRQIHHTDDVSAESCEPSAWFTAAADCWQFISWFSPSSAAYVFPFCHCAGTTSGFSKTTPPTLHPLVCSSLTFPTVLTLLGWNFERLLKLA